MVIDASAILAVLLEESDEQVYFSAIATSSVKLLSAATLLETSLVLLARRTPGGTSALDHFLARLKVTVISVDETQALIAREAFRMYGKGRHPARLNFGDCFSYALAKQTHRPLLCKGNDFPQTDILLA